MMVKDAIRAYCASLKKGPVHAREMKRGLLSGLLKLAGLSPDEFRAL
ncbi:MAG: hypothetical protein HZB91_03465 [Elusimicrobia bacterium]|nr:hypothetical protein [Elusimicrobiota bacterium]